MASEGKYPVTPAVRVLREAGITFTPHLYDYEEKGGTHYAALSLGVDEHAVIKTLVMETDRRDPLIVLMHGDRDVAVGTLARAIDAKSARLCDAATAQKHTGYQLGGTSPLGTRNPALPVYAERTLFALPKIYLNGGKRGFLVAFAPVALRDLLTIAEVEVATPINP